MTRGKKSEEATLCVSYGARLPEHSSLGQCKGRLKKYAEKCGTHIWQTAITAGTDLGLVCVDEDPRVSRRPAACAAVADNDALVRPLYRLLVDKFHGRVGLWLSSRHAVNVPLVLNLGRRIAFCLPGDRSRSARISGQSSPWSEAAGSAPIRQSGSVLATLPWVGRSSRSSVEPFRVVRSSQPQPPIGALSRQRSGGKV